MWITAICSVRVAIELADSNIFPIRSNFLFHYTAPILHGKFVLPMSYRAGQEFSVSLRYSRQNATILET